MALSCFLAAIVAQGPKGITYDNNVNFVYNTLAFPANYFYRLHHIDLVVYLDAPEPVRVIFLDQIVLLPWPLQTRNVEFISVTLVADFGLRVVYNLIEAAPAFVYFQTQPISDWTLLFTHPFLIESLEFINDGNFDLRVVYNLVEAATNQVYFLPLPIVVPTFFKASSSSVVKLKLLLIHPPMSWSKASKTFTTAVSTLASTTLPQMSIGLTTATPLTSTVLPILITAKATTLTTAITTAIITSHKNAMLYLVSKETEKTVTASPLSTVLPSPLTTALPSATTITANSVTTTSFTSTTTTTVTTITTTTTSTSTERHSPKMTTTTPKTLLTSSALVMRSPLCFKCMNHFNLILISFVFIYQIKWQFFYSGTFLRGHSNNK
jgi:hypothetical protein